METHRTIMFQGQQIHYRDEGRTHDKTLVLLHGYLQSLEVWSSYVLTYMRSMRVITIDLPGHGQSAVLSDVHTMELMADVVKAVLDQAGIEQCVMVGHSLGGYVTLAFADKYPFYLRGFGLINSHALADSEEDRQRRARNIEQIHANRAGYILGFIGSLFDPSRRTYMGQEIKDLQDDCLETTAPGAEAAQRGMALRPSRVAILSKAEVPILFVIGKNDPRIPVELALSQAMEARHAEILMIDGVGHMAHLEERDYVKLRLLNFVSTCYY